MRNGSIVILRGQEVLSLLKGREAEVLGAVESAYLAHAAGSSSLPHSNFLRFPGDDTNRIIALPAYLGDDFRVAGIKWIASFPANQALGKDRASAVVVLNSTTTGVPEAFIEGSIISAKRTAASAALAGRVLQGERRAERLGLIGCGLINFETARFLRHTCPEVTSYLLFDKDPARAELFRVKCLEAGANVDITFAHDAEDVLAACPLVSLATTAVRPHLSDISACPPGSTILHVSLRDFTAEAVLASDNIVDDVDHVSRAQTSIHLAEQQVGNRDFVRATLADVISGTAPARRDANTPTIFSPFGLGVLDMALSKLVLDAARREKRGTFVEDFLPEPWAANASAGAASG
jgi:N-[(2S)-2-amino-2-carboxyethyl]-L-glutamate dehydrogenase